MRFVKGLSKKFIIVFLQQLFLTCSRNVVVDDRDAEMLSTGVVMGNRR